MSASRHILHLSHSDSGGAGKAALRLCQAQRAHGLDAKLLVLHKSTSLACIELFYPRPGFLPRLRREYARHRSGPALDTTQTSSGYPYSEATSPYRDDLAAHLAQADIIHLHWTAGFLHLPILTHPALAEKRFIWTLHDFQPVTGGCHYPRDCTRHTQGCGECPLLLQRSPNDSSAQTSRLRQIIYQQLGSRLSFAAPSAWLAQQASQSSALGGRTVHVLRNPLDLDCFQPRDHTLCRQILDLPTDQPLVLFVADQPGDHRKGGDLIPDILKAIRQHLPVHFASVGAENPFPGLENHTPLGSIADDRLLALIYAAADCFLLPSRQDNMPNTVIESLACGTPVACFNIGGAPELVCNGQTGQLADAITPESLAQAALTILKHPAPASLHHQCRLIAQNQISPNRITEQSLHLYSC